VSHPVVYRRKEIAFPHFDHVFLMIEENHNYQQIIGNPAALKITRSRTTTGSRDEVCGRG
jgi:hypothetical protein